MLLLGSRVFVKLLPTCTQNPMNGLNAKLEVGIEDSWNPFRSIRQAMRELGPEFDLSFEIAAEPKERRGEMYVWVLSIAEENRQKMLAVLEKTESLGGKFLPVKAVNSQLSHEPFHASLKESGTPLPEPSHAKPSSPQSQPEWQIPPPSVRESWPVQSPAEW